MPDYKLRIFVEGIDQASGVLKGVGSALGDIGKVAAGVGIAGILGSATRGLMEMAGGALDSYAAYERLGLSLNSLAAKEAILTGQASTMQEAMAMTSGKSKELLDWVQKLAIESPFRQEDVSSAFRLSMALGFNTAEAQRLTKAMVDFSTATGAGGESIERVSRALGQMKTKGKLSAEEMLQLSEAGVDANAILMRAFDMTGPQLFEAMKKGAIDVNAAIEAIVSEMEKLYGGAAKNSAESMGGLLSTLSEIGEISSRNLMTGVFQSAQPYIAAISSFLTAPEFQAGLTAFGAVLGTFTTEGLESAAGAIQRMSDAVMPLLNAGAPGWLVALQAVMAADDQTLKINIQPNVTQIETPDGGLKLDITANATRITTAEGGEYSIDVKAKVISIDADTTDNLPPVKLVADWKQGTIGSLLAADWTEDDAEQHKILVKAGWEKDTIDALMWVLNANDWSQKINAFISPQSQAKITADLAVLSAHAVVLSAEWGADVIGKLWQRVQDFFSTRPVTVDAQGTIDVVTMTGTNVPEKVSNYVSNLNLPVPANTRFDPYTESTYNPPKRDKDKYPGHNALGTDNWRGGWTWVGERGPELLNLPAGSRILSNPESVRLADAVDRAASEPAGAASAQRSVSPFLPPAAGATRTAIDNRQWAQYDQRSIVGGSTVGGSTVVGSTVGGSTVVGDTTSSLFSSLASSSLSAISMAGDTVSYSALVAPDNSIATESSEANVFVAGGNDVRTGAAAVLPAQSERRALQVIAAIQGDAVERQSRAQQQQSRAQAQQQSRAQQQAVNAVFRFSPDFTRSGETASFPLGERAAAIRLATTSAPERGDAVADREEQASPLARLGGWWNRMRNSRQAAIDGANAANSPVAAVGGHAAAIPVAVYALPRLGAVTSEDAPRGGITPPVDVFANVQRRADGGPARGWAVVGERGPELAFFAGAGAHILSNERSAALLATAGVRGVPGFAEGTTPTDPAKAFFNALKAGAKMFGLWVPQKPAGRQYGPPTRDEAWGNWQSFQRKGVEAMQGAAQQTGDAFEKVAEQTNDAFKSALQNVPGLFGASPVTADQMQMAELGVPQNFADNYLRRLSDEVLNGVDWAGVDIGDAARRAGIDPNLPADVILQLFKESWNNSSLFANPANLDLIDQSAVKAAIEQQQQELAGKANIMGLFGIDDKNLQGQADALGAGLASVFGQAAQTDAMKAAGVQAFAAVGAGFSDPNTATAAVGGMANAVIVATGVPENRAALGDAGRAGAAAYYDGWKSAMSELPPVPPTGTTTLVGTAGGTATLTIPLPAGSTQTPVGHNALGTTNWRGGWTMVGEYGPELVDLPQGARVHDAGETRRWRAGRTQGRADGARNERPVVVNQTFVVNDKLMAEQAARRAVQLIRRGS